MLLAARNRFWSHGPSLDTEQRHQLVRSCPVTKTVTASLSTSSSSSMSSSDLSPRAKLNYDSDKFLVEFNVSEYSPEVNSNQARESVEIRFFLIFRSFTLKQKVTH